jgi:HSP20 family molecular chaperone IbpA
MVLMAEKTVATTTSPQVTSAPAEGTRNQEHYITPPVDIYETEDGLVVLADLPGVAQDSLDIGVDNNILTIRGRSSSMLPGEVPYREYELRHFFRQFELSNKVDQARISAELKHGVLMLQLPKAEEAKARRIDVQVG